MNEQYKTSVIDKMSEEVSNIIVKDVLTQQLNKSELTNALYYANKIEFDCSKYLIIRELNIEYVVYWFKNFEEFNSFIKSRETSLEFDSESDYQCRCLKVVSVIVGGEFLGNQILKKLVTHLYQYDECLKKDIYLHDEAVGLCLSGDKTDKVIGNLLSFTFKWEQDILANQFFQTIAKFPVIGYYEGMEKFSIYGFAEDCLKSYKSLKCEETKLIIENLGMTEEEYEERVTNGLKRLKQKLKNAHATVFLRETSGKEVFSEYVEPYISEWAN
jgi:hypothetical protein